MVCWNCGRLWRKCVLIFVFDVCCTSENPLPIVEGVWCMCNTMKTGRYGAWLSTVAGQMLTGSDLGTKHAWHTDTFSYWCCQRARHSLGTAQNCLGPTGLQRSVCALGFWESRRWWQSSLYVTVSVWHVTLIKESSFEVETWLITQNL